MRISLMSFSPSAVVSGGYSSGVYIHMCTYTHVRVGTPLNERRKRGREGSSTNNS